MSTIAATASTISKSASPRVMSTPTLPPRFSSQDRRIRLRLLHSLGIQEPKQAIQKRIRPKPITEFHSINYFKTVSAPFLQPLQDSIGGAPRATSTFSSSLFSNSHANNTRQNDDLAPETPHKRSDSNNRNVRFDDDVLVVPIPSRHAYSDRIKRTIWRDAGELRDIVNRNRYEYTSEGWDSSKVLEDDDMYIDIATGEKVHPCWVEGGDVGEADEDVGEIKNSIE